MINLEQFTKKHVISRDESMFLPDIVDNADALSKEIKGRSVLVIGGAGSIGQSFIKAVLRFEPAELYVVDLNENGLAELTRDLRSTDGLKVPDVFLTYTLDFADPVFEQILREHGRFDIVANFSAHKHVRSEKDRFSVEALLRNNVIKARGLLELLSEFRPDHYFCVSTDKAANPVNVMGASKRVMEDLIMAYSDRFKVTTARFANVAFSNGSLPLSFVERMMKRQPLVAPRDVRRYFVSLEESGQICMLACLLGRNGEVFYPKLVQESMKTFSSICDDFLAATGHRPLLCRDDNEAKARAAAMHDSDVDYPVVYFDSDTTGEKDVEEFTVESETTDTDRYKSLGVVTSSTRRPKADVSALINRLDSIFTRHDFTKAEVVDCLRDYLPNFHHEELGRNLDQKM